MQTQTRSEPQATACTEPQRAEERLHAPADVYETPEAWHLAVALPGVRRDDLEVQLEGDSLRIAGRRPAFEREGFQPLRGRLAAGVFERTFLVPEGITAEHVEADLQQGLLHLTLRKPVPERRSIPIRSA